MNKRNIGNLPEPLSKVDYGVLDEEARTHILEATRQTASLVESTYGPVCLDTVVEDKASNDKRDLIVTSRGSLVLDVIERNSGFSDPVAAVFVDALDSMERRLGDGTTTAALLACALIRRGAELIDKGLHPVTVSIGYGIANAYAGETLDALSRPVDPSDRSRLADIARTALNSISNPAVRDQYAEVIAEVIANLAATDEPGVNLDNVKIVSAANAADPLVRGVVVQRGPSPADESEWVRSNFEWELEFPKAETNLTVAIMDDAIEFEELSTTLSQSGRDNFVASSRAEMAQYQTALEAHQDSELDRLGSLDIDVLVAQPRLNTEVRNGLRRRGIAVIDKVQYPLSDVYLLADAMDATVVSDLADLDASVLGTATHVREQRFTDEKWTIFEGKTANAYTIVIVAGTAGRRARLNNQLDAALEITAVAAIDQQILPSAGGHALAVAHDLKQTYAPTIPEREQLAVDAFADALTDIVNTLVSNAGEDPLMILPSLREAYERRGYTPGYDVLTHKIVDPYEVGLVEPRRLFSHAIETAYGITELLLLTDAFLYPTVPNDGLPIPLTERD